MNRMTFKKASRATALIALGLAAHPAISQESVTTSDEIESQEIDAMEPGVDTSAFDAESSAPESPATPTEEGLELAADVTRSQSDGYVMDRMELGRTEITGNQELPKVLYIVPWRQSDPGDLMGKPVNSLMDEVLAPLDREEFVRDVDYYDEVYGDRGAQK